MCFVIAVIGLVLSVSFILKGLYWYALFSGVAALLFAALMIRNILHVKKERSKKDNNHDH